MFTTYLFGLERLERHEFWVSDDVTRPRLTATVLKMLQLLSASSADIKSMPHGAAFGCSVQAKANKGIAFCSFPCCLLSFFS